MTSAATGAADGVREVSKEGWRVVSFSAETPRGGKAVRAIDGRPGTLWHTHTSAGELPPPHEIVVDMGRELNVKSLTYLPRQDGQANGIVQGYKWFLSRDGTIWGDAVLVDAFDNIEASPVRQLIGLPKPVTARYFKFVAVSSVQGAHITVAELGVVEVGERE